MHRVRATEDLAYTLRACPDVRPEGGQGERVERQHVLGILGLAVGPDDPTVHDYRVISIDSVPASRSSRSRRAPASSHRRMPEVASSTHSAKKPIRPGVLQEPL